MRAYMIHIDNLFQFAVSYSGWPDFTLSWKYSLGSGLCDWLSVQCLRLSAHYQPTNRSVLNKLVDKFNGMENIQLLYVNLCCY